MRRNTHWLLKAIVLGSVLLPSGSAAPDKTSLSVNIDVAPEELLSAPVGANWTSYNGDYTGKRFSSLNQINKNNVGQLRVEWVFHAPNSSALEVTPVVYQGLMFVTSANDAYALDAQTGRVVWHYSRAYHRRTD